MSKQGVARRMTARRRRTTVRRWRTTARILKTTRRDGSGKDNPSGQEVNDMLDKGAGTGRRRARMGKERETKRMGWTGTWLGVVGRRKDMLTTLK